MKKYILVFFCLAFIGLQSAYAIELNGPSPLIFDGEKWVNEIHIDATTVDTAHGKVRMNSDGSYSFYDNGKLIFTDSIAAKYADMSDLSSWTLPNSINDATPSNIWNGTYFVTTKESTIGQLQYKYIHDGTKWKTQLEAVNLSGLTTKAFGFDQTIDLETDNVFFGGHMRNLDNYDSQTFDRDWIVTNQGRVIDFLDGNKFDFDIAFNDLYSITVYDTGVNKSRLVFDYRTSVPLLPNERLILDPAITQDGAVVTDSGTTATSDSTAITVGSNANRILIIMTNQYNTASDTMAVTVGGNPATLADTGSRVGYGYVKIWYYVNPPVGSNTVAISMTTGTAYSYEIYSLYNVDQSTPIGATSNTGASSPTQPNGTITPTNTGSWIMDALGTVSTATPTASLTSGYSVNPTGNIWDTGQYDATPTIGSSNSMSWSGLAGGFHWAWVGIEVRPTPPAINMSPDVTISVIGDTARISGTIDVIQSPKTNVTSILTIVNGTTINTNSTFYNSTTVPYSVNFGPFWYQMTTGSNYNFTVAATAQNSTSLITNGTSVIDQREYDPIYANAVDNPSTQGQVNATVTRFDSQDGLLLKVNRQGVSTGDTWQIECIAQTNTQAAQTKNQTQSWQGTWSNTTNTGYFNTTFSGFALSHAYITCFNEDVLFTLTDFTSSSLALLGIQLFDESYGSMIGVPVGIFFLVMTAGMANKRTAPTFIILITGIAGTMATIGFFSFEPLVWGLALVTAMLGIFVNQKIF